MPEKSSIFQSVQIGLQTLAGTGVAANKKLLSVSLVPNAKAESNPFRAMGNKYASFVSLNKEWVESSIDGDLTYNEINYLLASLIAAPVFAQQSTTTAYKATFTPNTSSEDAGKLLTVEQGDATTAWKSIDNRVRSLGLTFNRSGVKVSGSALGGPLETGITLTGSPTSLTPKPVLPTHLKFYLADTQAGLAGASALTRGFSAEFRLNDKASQAWPVGQDPVIVEGEPDLGLKLSLATDAVGMGLLATMRAGATKWVRIKAEGETIESTYKYTFQLDMPVQILMPNEFKDEDGIYLVEYDCKGIHDATWGKAFEIFTISTMSTL